MLLNLLAQADAASTAQVNSIWDFMVKGGPMMIPLGVCSLAALTIIVERIISLRTGQVVPTEFVQSVRTTMKTSQEQALALCNKSSYPIGRILAAGIRHLSAPLDVLKDHIREVGAQEVARLSKYLRFLSLIAAIAPLIGLLGTLFGMIKAFQTVAISSGALGKTEMMATGIYEALITTAAGLLVAIPVLVCQHWLSSRVDRVVLEMDLVTTQFVEDVMFAKHHTPVTTEPLPAVPAVAAIAS